MQNVDYSRISITARMVARFREFSDIPFAQDVADYVKAREALEEISEKMEVSDMNPDQRAKMAEESKIYAPLLEGRYKSIVEVIRRTGVSQVLELASGFSLRGLAMASESDLRYVESDLPGINELKAPLVEKLKAKYELCLKGSHEIVTANAFDVSELEKSVDSLDSSEPIAVVNEGLIPYLSSEELAVFADNVRGVISKFAGGYWITPDFTTKRAASSVSEHRKQFVNAIKGATDRQIQEAAFDSEEAIDAFLDSHGFSGTSSFQVDENINLVSMERLSIDPRVLETLRPHMRLWLLSVH